MELNREVNQEPTGSYFLSRKAGSKEQTMLNMKYIGSDTVHQVSFRKISDHIVEVRGEFAAHGHAD